MNIKYNGEMNMRLVISIYIYVNRQYRGNEGQMRELQDQLEAEQYFSVSLQLKLSSSVLFI